MSETDFRRAFPPSGAPPGPQTVADAYAFLAKPQAASAEGRASWLDWLRSPAARQSPVAKPTMLHAANAGEFASYLDALSAAPRREPIALAIPNLRALPDNALGMLRGALARVDPDGAAKIDRCLREREADRVDVLHLR
jgi:hypothetical protein